MSLVFATVTGCASSTPSLSPRLAFVPGRLTKDPAPPECDLVEWTAPRDTVTRICLEPETAVEITRRDIYGVRLEDRQFGDRTWYFVSALLAGDIGNRLWELLRAPPNAGDETPLDPKDPDFVFGRDKPFAVLIGRESSVVLPAIALSDFKPLVATTQDLSHAEAIAYAWGIPVMRVLSAEIGAQPIEVVSLVQLIANPSAWIGRRIQVRGYLGAPLRDLYLSREHAEAFDHASSVHVQLPAVDRDVDVLADCEGKWVLVEGFVDTHVGLAELTRLERVYSDDTTCWPLPSEAK